MNRQDELINQIHNLVMEIDSKNTELQGLIIELEGERLKDL